MSASVITHLLNLVGLKRGMIYGVAVLCLISYVLGGITFPRKGMRRVWRLLWA